MRQKQLFDYVSDLERVDNVNHNDNYDNISEFEVTNEVGLGTK